MLTTAHLINLLPIKGLGFKTPFELLYTRVPSYSHLKSFGCLCYATKPHVTDKFESKVIKRVFIGYPLGKKGYKILDLYSRKCFYSRDVTFDDTEFSFHTTFVTTLVDNSVPDLLFPLSITIADTSDSSIPSLPSTQQILPPPTTTSTSPSQVSTPDIPRPSRVKTFPDRFKDFKWLPSTHAILPSLPPTPTSGKVPDTATYPIQAHLSYAKFTPTHQAYLAATSKIATPYTFNQAALNPLWFKAMQTEIAALEGNHTWDLVVRPPNHHIIYCKWLFKVKYLPDG